MGLPNRLPCEPEIVNRKFPDLIRADEEQITFYGDWNRLRDKAVRQAFRVDNATVKKKWSSQDLKAQHAAEELDLAWRSILEEALRMKKPGSRIFAK